MTVFDKINSCVQRVNSNIPQKTRKQKVKLYAEGLKAKIIQVNFALDKLSEFNNKGDDTATSTAQDTFTITDQVYFYSDTFWTFLYSSLDVLAQVVNQAKNLEFDEKNVSFDQVNSKLQGNKYKESAVAKKFAECAKSKAFKNLDRYRNCSTHRRQIYIEEEIKKVKRTAGYQSSSTGPVITVVRTLCDDPLVLNPKTSQNRRIPTYMIKTRDKILQHIEQILKETHANR